MPLTRAARLSWAFSDDPSDLTHEAVWTFHTTVTASNAAYLERDLRKYYRSKQLGPLFMLTDHGVDNVNGRPIAIPFVEGLLSNPNSEAYILTDRPCACLHYHPPLCQVLSTSERVLLTEPSADVTPGGRLSKFRYRYHDETASPIVNGQFVTVSGEQSLCTVVGGKGGDYDDPLVQLLEPRASPWPWRRKKYRTAKASQLTLVAADEDEAKE